MLYTQNEVEKRLFYKVILRKSNPQGPEETVLLESGDKVLMSLDENKTAVVGSGLSATYNLGNYQSVRIEVNLQLPVTLETKKPSEISNKLNTVYDFVQTKLIEQVDNLAAKAKDLF